MAGSNSKPPIGSTVKVLRPFTEEEEWIEVEVVELLSAQFVWRAPNGDLGIQLYNTGGWAICCN